MTLEHDHAAHEDGHGHDDHEGHEHGADAHAGHDHGAGGHDDHGGHDEHAGHDHPEHDHSGHEHVDYPTAVAAFRAEKDEFFRTNHDSPLPEAERATFTGLPYFPVDEALRFEGVALEPYRGNEPTTFQIPTSDGQLRPAERAGTFSFEVGGATQRLTAYRVAQGEANSLFLPFLDTTSGTETYGAGRYLDLYPEEDATWSIDFNLAYHPSCVYDMRFSCPLTPAENRLPLRIEAGERLPDDHA